MNSKINELPPKDRTIIAPDHGWEESSLYVVDVSFTDSNPIHRAVFFTGFLDSDGNPAGYNQIYNPTYERTFLSIHQLHYLRPVRLIGDVFAMGRNRSKR